MEQPTLFDDTNDAIEAAIPSRKYNAPGLPARARKILKTDGLYNYALLIREVQAYNEEYVQQRFRTSKAELCFVLINEFNQAVGHQETHEEFLRNVKNIPGYGLQQI